ncbi:MAG: class I SAM-dependent methyltransferase [Candidatus Riflebacteria bacterium]|nr:class I SAM-dependent methyltransferase [Candidatus Riflebacteria bacterium]
MASSSAVNHLLACLPFVRAAALYGLSVFPRRLPGGRLLDVGCGNGRLLSVMRGLGWSVFGVERDPVSAAVARESCGAVIYPSLDDPGLEVGSMDVVTMTHVLEHMPAPAGVVRRCSALLRPGGRLGIAVPNWRAFTHRVFGRFQFDLDAPRHLVMFETVTLERLVQAEGLVVESVKTDSSREAGSAIAKSWLNEKERPMRRFARWVWTVAGHLAPFVTPDCGEEIVLWASKR